MSSVETDPSHRLNMDFRGFSISFQQSSRQQQVDKQLVVMSLSRVEPSLALQFLSQIFFRYIALFCVSPIFPFYYWEPTLIASHRLLIIQTLEVGLDRTGNMSFLTGQDRTPKFAGRVLPDRTESGLLFISILPTNYRLLLLII